MQTIELNKVRKSYDQFVAVNSLSFSIEQGGVFACWATAQAKPVPSA